MGSGGGLMGGLRVVGGLKGDGGIWGKWGGYGGNGGGVEWGGYRRAMGRMGLMEGMGVYGGV